MSDRHCDEDVAKDGTFRVPEPRPLCTKATLVVLFGGVLAAAMGVGAVAALADLSAFRCGVSRAVAGVGPGEPTPLLPCWLWDTAHNESFPPWLNARDAWAALDDATQRDVTKHVLSRLPPHEGCTPGDNLTSDCLRRVCRRGSFLGQLGSLGDDFVDSCRRNAALLIRSLSNVFAGLRPGGTKAAGVATFDAPVLEMLLDGGVTPEVRAQLRQVAVNATDDAQRHCVQPLTRFFGPLTNTTGIPMPPPALADVAARTRVATGALTALPLPLLRRLLDSTHVTPAALAACAGTRVVPDFAADVDAEPVPVAAILTTAVSPFVVADCAVPWPQLTHLLRLKRIGFDAAPAEATVAGPIATFLDAQGHKVEALWQCAMAAPLATGHNPCLSGTAPATGGTSDGVVGDGASSATCGAIELPRETDVCEALRDALSCL